jgi:hypothetical protein
MLKQQGVAMSKMSELVLDVENLLDQGLSFAEVARTLEIPVNFVIESADIIRFYQEEEEFSPHATVNS